MRPPIKPFIRQQGNEILVGAVRDEPGNRYYGPLARITYDKDWLHITTDEYGSHAMLNIESLPMLRRALTQVANKLRKASKP